MIEILKIGTRARVFHYIKSMSEMTAKQTGKRGVYPTATQIGLVFDFSRQQGAKYLEAFKKTHKDVINLRDIK
jgi:tRNA A37 threonylcarbamoyladenosine synthetase subunit TsaC/SUA5/YrdC